MRIVLTKHKECGFETVCEYGYVPNGYIILSEPIEVVFQMLPQEDIVKAQVEAIDEQIKKTQAECEVKINLLKDEKAKLLALTWEGE